MRRCGPGCSKVSAKDILTRLVYFKLIFTLHTSCFEWWLQVRWILTLKLALFCPLIAKCTELCSQFRALFSVRYRPQFYYNRSFNVSVSLVQDRAVNSRLILLILVQCAYLILKKSLMFRSYFRFTRQLLVSGLFVFFLTCWIVRAVKRHNIYCNYCGGFVNVGAVLTELQHRDYCQATAVIFPSCPFSPLFYNLMSTVHLVLNFEFRTCLNQTRWFSHVY